MRGGSDEFVCPSNRNIESFHWVWFVGDLLHRASQILTDKVDTEQFLVLFDHLRHLGFEHLVGEFDAL